MRCWQGNIDALRQAISSSDDLNAVDADGRTPLINACGQGFTEMVELLLTHGVDIDHQDKQGFTALHFSVMNKPNPVILEMLLNNDARVDIHDVWGNTALGKAVFEMSSPYRMECVRRLVRAGSDPDIKNEYGVSPRTLSQTIAVGSIDWDALQNE